MGLWCLKILFFLFALLSTVSLGLGFYAYDVIVISIGILFTLTAIIIVLELKQLLSSPFRRD